MPLALAGVVYCYLCSRCFAGGDTASDNLGSAPNHQGRFTLLAALAFIVVTALFMYYGQVKKLEQLENLSGRDLDYNLKFLLADWPRAFQILWSSSWHYLALDKMTSPLGWTNVMISAETTAYWKSLLCTAFGVDLLLAAGILWQQVRRRGWATLLRHSAIALGLWILLLVGLFGFNIANALALYIHWSPRDAMGVAGLQNRYFLPFFLVLLASIPSALVRPLRFAKQEGTQPAESRQSVTLTLLAICVSLALILPYCGLVLIEVLTRYY